jgi:hypothetical protein
VLPFRRARHSSYLVIGVDTAAVGRGLGRDLLAAAEREASGRGLRRLELTVMTDNLRAVGLYLRGGFRVEGLRHHALQRDDAPCQPDHGITAPWLSHDAQRDAAVPAVGPDQGEPQGHQGVHRASCRSVADEDRLQAATITRRVFAGASPLGTGPMRAW